MYLKVQGNLLTKDWIIDDDKIIYGNGKKVYDINLIHDLRIDRPSFGGDGAIKFMYEGDLKFLVYARADKEIAEIAFEYLQENSIDKILNEVKNLDIKMRCNVCGKIYCYTINDLEANVKNAKMAMVSSVGAVANALVGTQIGYYGSSAEADRHLNKVIDYSRCPSCHSSNVSELTEEEFLALSTKQETNSNGISGADEILKYKNLLDQGIITQDEFETKKKQLLGL